METIGLFSKDDFEENIESSKNTLVKNLEVSLKKLFEGYDKLQEETGKGDLKYVFISFLRTGVYDQKYIYRIDYYDSKKYGDLVEYAGYWDISCLSDGIYAKHVINDISFRKEYLKQSITIDKNVLVEFEFLHEALAAHMLEIVEQSMKNIGEDTIRFVRFYFGEYLEKSQYLCNTN